MLVSDKFLFLHLQKSGGTFVNQLMVACLPGARKLGYHLPGSEIPAELCDKPVLGTVRNPFAFYVSWYSFQVALGPGRWNSLFETCSEGGALDFGHTIEKLVLLERRPETVEALIKVFPDRFVDNGPNLTKRCIAGISNSGIGFYSFLYRRMFDAVPRATILRAEELRASLSAYLASCYPEIHCWRHFLEQAPNMNSSPHGPVEPHYSNDLRQLVAELDRDVFQAHGYAPS